MDYYSTLGVSKNASDKELKQAYKKASMQHHPDRGGDENKFKEINEAYSTLKDPQKRGMYDHQQNGGGQGFNFNTQNMEDIFGAMFGQRQQQQRSNRSPNKSVRVHHTLNLIDTIEGKQEVVNYTLPNGRSKIINVTIPKGVINGQIVRYSGLGEDTYSQYPPGNLEIQFRVINNTQFVIKDYDLIYNMPLDYFDLLLGKDQMIRTISGRKINLKIKAGTNPSSTLSINNEGLYHFNSERRGNLYITFKVSMPELTSRQLEIIDKIKLDLNK